MSSSRTLSARQLSRQSTKIRLKLRAIVLCLLILIAPHTTNAESQAVTASRIQAKIGQVGARAVKLREAGGDVSTLQRAMQQVDKLLRSGDIEGAEKILDTLITDLGGPSTDLAPVAATPSAEHNCDPRQPMVVSGAVTVTADCMVGGDLTVTGSGVLHFDYSGRNGGRLVVAGNVNVRDHATLWIQGGPSRRAIFVINNDSNDQRAMTSTDNAAIKLDRVEFRTQEPVNPGKGSVSMNYHARDQSSLYVTGSTVVEEAAWLLANLHDAAKLTVIDTQHVPNEVYVRDSASVQVGGGTRTGLWLDAGGAKGNLTLPDVNGPFSWRVGAGNGLDVGWSLQIEQSEPGIGIEVRPSSALTITGAGRHAPVTGEVKISYFVIGAQETLDHLKAGLQNGTVSNRLTLKNVQLGPIAWQIYVGDNADLSITNSTINEIGVFGRNARVRVQTSVLQLAALAAIGPGSSLDIRNSEIWNQTIEAANKAAVSIADSNVHGTLFHTGDSESVVSITGGSFYGNAAHCRQVEMVDIASGQPRCNPFRAPGMPSYTGAGKTSCHGTQGCTWAK